jgi:hypothetical protein
MRVKGAGLFWHSCQIRGPVNLSLISTTSLNTTLTIWNQKPKPIDFPQLPIHFPQNLALFHSNRSDLPLWAAVLFIPPIGTHIREAPQSIIILIWAATRKIMDGRERKRRRKSWRSSSSSGRLSRAAGDWRLKRRSSSDGMQEEKLN